MLVDRSVTAQFDVAEDSLLVGLGASCDSSALQCAISSGTADRQFARATTFELVKSIKNNQQHSQMVQRELERAQTYTLKLCAHVPKPSSPCGALPVEILCKIFYNAVGDPSNHQTIRSIAGVSDLWRAVVLSMSLLFVQADWDRWPTSLLELWCARANRRPLTVKLGELGVTRVVQRQPSDFNRLLESSKAAWEVLEVRMGHIGQSERDALVEVLLNNGLVSLQCLRLSVPRSYAPTVAPMRANLPMLREVHLEGVAIHSAKPSITLRHVTINLSNLLSWSDWTQILHPLSGLTTLALTNIRPANLSLQSRLELPELTALRLDSSSSDGTIANLLGSLSLPNAHSVVLRDIIYYTSSDIPNILVSFHVLLQIHWS